jgi:signal transduction histidine kinase/CheY-like chemotaxis protein/HAMP domain-containing protein
LNDALRVLTQASLVLVFALAVVDYARHRGRRRLDVALMLGALASLILVQGLRAVGLPLPAWAGRGVAVVLLAHPYLMLRVVAHYRPMPRVLHVLAPLGFVASALAFIALPTLPPVLFAVVAYFALAEGYAAVALARAAYSAPGETRRQLTLAAAGSVLLALVIALAGVGLAVPGLSRVLSPLSSLLGALAAVAYYLGFAPPGWIAEAWRGLRLGTQVVPIVAGAALVTAAGSVWAALAAFPETASLDLTTPDSLRALGAVLALIVILSAAGALAAALLFRPLHQLGETAERFGAGDYTARVPQSQGAADLRALATRFNAMADAVQAHTAASELARETAERFATQRARLLSLVEAVGAETRPRQVAERIVESVADLVPATSWGLLLPVPDGGLEVVAAGGEAAEGRKGRHLAVGTGITGRVFQTGTPELIEDVRADPDFVALLSDVRSELTVPLRHADRTIGVLNFESPEVGAFNYTHLSLVLITAAHAALALVRAQLTERLRAQNTALEDASRQKSEFLANMSHELRTPLNAINGFSELLLVSSDEELTAETRRHYAQTIHDSGSHLLQLINDILDLSKVEAGKMDLRPEPLDVAAIIHRVIGTVQPLAEKKGILIAADAPASVPLVADEGKLKQILYNLVSNAIKFTPEGGAVVVTAAERTDAVQLTISDTGIGIAAEHHERIFEEFHQVDTGAARRYEGTGLGLSLTRRLVELHGGEIWVESAPSQGSQFHVRLPTTPRPASTPGDAGERPTNGVVAPTAMLDEFASGPLVLVVEDDVRSSSLLAAHLRRAGYRVRFAETGEQALHLARTLRPAAITLDILLPDLDGWEVLRALKSDPETREIPATIVSVVDDQALGYALGAVDYLVKPIEGEALIKTLRRLTLTTKVREREVRVLVVDDDPAAVELLTGLLRPLGLTVLTARGGADAIARARAHPPDLVLLDLMMPEVSGFDVVEALRADPQTHSVKIVVVTAKDLTRDDQAALNGRVAAVLRKGDSVTQEVLTWLRDLLGT